MARATTVATERSRFVIAVVVVLVTGCGYVRSGRWEDDPRNWERAFRSTKPDDVVVLHSQYWRAPHWSYEAGYVFELEANGRLREELFKGNRLRQLDLAEVGDVKSMCFSTCPAWFAPEPLSQYAVWAYADDKGSNFRLLIYRTTGHIFLVDFQV
jgi:hypothetical protein